MATRAYRLRVRATVGPIRCASGHGPAGAAPWDGRAVPRTRPIELPVALLLATAAFAFSVAGACAVLLAGLVVVAGHAEVVLRAGWPTWCAAAALGCANAAGLLALTRRSGGLHPLSLAAAWLLGFAVPLPGAPVPAALAAAAGTGLAVRLGARRGPAANALPAAAALALAALALLVVAFDGADGAVPLRPAARAALAPARPAERPPPPARAADPAPRATGRDRARVLPRARRPRLRPGLARARAGRPAQLRRLRPLARGLRRHALEPPVRPADHPRGRRADRRRAGSRRATGPRAACSCAASTSAGGWCAARPAGAPRR